MPVSLGVQEGLLLMRVVVGLIGWVAAVLFLRDSNVLA